MIKSRALFVMGMATIAFTASAQKPVQDIGQAFDEFYSELYKGGNITSSSQNSYEGGNDQYFYFKFPKKKSSKAVSDFDKILFDNHVLSYSSFVKKTGTDDSQTLKVSRGSGREDVIFGSDNAHNYNVQIFSDRLDSTKRYVYALVWYTNGYDLLGSAWKIYGNNPKAGTGKRRSDYPFPKRIKRKAGSENISSLEYDDAASSTKIETGPDFLRQFNNLHTLFTELNDQYTDYRQCEGGEKARMVKIMNLMAGTFTKASDMCANYYNVLTKEQKKFVAAQLRDMAKDAKISYFADGFRSLANNLMSKDTSFRLYNYKKYRLYHADLAATDTCFQGVVAPVPDCGSALNMRCTDADALSPRVESPSEG